MPEAESPWSVLAPVWEGLFPLRPARVRWALERTPPGGAVLDAGCGSGDLVAALLAQGREARGFDLDPVFAARAASRAGGGDRIATASLTEIAEVFPGRCFDLVACLGQVFPHLLDDEQVDLFLEGARTRLAPGGRLALQVVSDEGAGGERILPTLECDGFRLDRTRRLAGPGRAELELRLSGPGVDRSWRVEHRIWSPDALAAQVTGSGWRVARLAADESGTTWTGREPGWLLELAAT